jgi:hypothetical protein
MFDLKDVNINSRKYTNMVLSNIFELLKDDPEKVILKNQKGETITDKEEVPDIDYYSLKRPELLGMVKERENKPKGYSRLTNVKLIEFLKEVK